MVSWVSIKTLLLSPTTFFEEHRPASTLPIAAGCVALLAVILTVVLLVLGSMLAEAVEGTVTMENSDRPPDRICDLHADDPESLIGALCDEPETIERPAGDVMEEAVQGLLWVGVFAPVILWALGTIVIYGAGRLAGGTPSLQGALSIAGWAALPELVRATAGIIALHFALADVRIDDPEHAVSVIEGTLAPIEPVLLVASLVTLVWQWFLLSGGLANEADIPWTRAAVAVGIPLGMFFLLVIG